MASPIFPYSVVAVTGTVLAQEGPLDVSWAEGTLASAVVAVSLFFIRRSDADARRERADMRKALHRQSRQIAALVKGYGDHGLPLPEDYSRILAENDQETT